MDGLPLDFTSVKNSDVFDGITRYLMDFRFKSRFEN